MIQRVTSHLYLANTYRPLNKSTVDTLYADLLNWRALYYARTYLNYPCVRLIQLVNLANAFEDIRSLRAVRAHSGASDRRAERSLCRADQLKEWYRRLAHAKLSGVRWLTDAGVVDPDTSPYACTAHRKKLPQGLLGRMYECVVGWQMTRGVNESTY
ncbi:hypothetical protein J3A83DRAFT_2943380 [Scleroderma citrinum]